MILTQIESTLTNHINPSYLSVTQEEGYILVVLSHSNFINMPIAERIQSVYDILEVYIPEVLQETVIIQAFGNNEMEIIIEDMFPGEEL